MDASAIYRDKSPSLRTKGTLAAIHFAIVIGVLWMLFGGGIGAIAHMFGAEPHPGSSLRRTLLALAALLYFVRVLGTLFVFGKRRMPWSEVATIAVWVGIIDVLFAYFGGSNQVSPGIWTFTGVVVVLLGSAVNTGSEWQRMVWKGHPENKGHLYTGGMWKLSRHVNYFGDLVLFTGWVMLTGEWGLAIIPLIMFGGFAFANVPAQDRYLSGRYGEEYKSYEKKTARLIPFIY